MKVLCKVKPDKYITLPANEDGKRNMVNEGEEFTCTKEQAMHYEKDGLVEIVSSFVDKKDVEEEIAEEEVVVEEVEPKEEKPKKLRRRKIE